MKISKWAYSIEEGPIDPVYVYEAPVRFWHWAQCAAFFMLVITGFLIGWPPIANYATTWDTYFFGNIVTQIRYYYVPVNRSRTFNNFAYTIFKYSLY